jgi:hypothetical protein
VLAKAGAGEAAAAKTRAARAAPVGAMSLSEETCAAASTTGMAGYRITPVLGFWTARALYWVEFTFETGFELPSSWSALP